MSGFLPFPEDLLLKGLPCRQIFNNWATKEAPFPKKIHQEGDMLEKWRSIPFSQINQIDEVMNFFADQIIEIIIKP